MKTLRRVGACLLPCLLAVATARAAEEPVLNLYSARHYQTDEALYANFTKATGIRINRIEASDDQLVERLKGEGAASPADVLLIVDAARLWQAKQTGLFQPVASAALAERIPAAFRDPDGHWYGFSYRARALVYGKGTVDAAAIATYEALADPKNKGKVCARSGSHPYNLSLVAAMRRPRRRSESRGLGEGGRRQHGAEPPRRRFRPDQGCRRRRVRGRPRQHVLLRARLALHQARGPRGHRARPASSCPTRRSSARTSTSPAAAC